ncbi:MAG: hypothetical protein MJZ36_03195 [Bacteroidaceae bacterium]|nr:hypothetical protein [Bacteroidaceae bacterium]
MKRKLNIFAIIAVVMVAMAALILGSCNSDDEFDYYGEGMYTMAEGLLNIGELPPSIQEDSIVYVGTKIIDTDYNEEVGGPCEFSITIVQKTGSKPIIKEHGCEGIADNEYTIVLKSETINNNKCYVDILIRHSFWGTIDLKNVQFNLTVKRS